jgi:tetratricopeptide (TPR) repeat protein
MKAASGLAIAVLLLLAAVPMDPEMALAEGNRLFEKDEVEAALAAYARGYTSGGVLSGTLASTLAGTLANTLAYNAGTCALRLGRLPEALLWYRRAQAANPDDPWLRDNLALTRRALGDPPEAPLSAGAWLDRRRGLAVAGVALAWGALAVLILGRRGGVHRLLPLLALLACAAFAAGTLLGRFGPRAAVLLAACPAEGGLPALPPGTEVWVRPAAGGGWRIVGQTVGHRSGLRCPAEAVGLVAP